MEIPARVKGRSECSEESSDNQVFPEILRGTLMKLPVPFRTAVVIVDRMQLDYATAAYILSVSPADVKSRVAQGRKRIQEIWFSENADRGQYRAQEGATFQP